MQCAWNKHSPCRSNALNYAKNGDPVLCRKHLNRLESRRIRDEMSQKSTRAFKTLKPGDLVRLYWGRSGIRYVFGVVVKGTAKGTEAALLSCKETPVDSTPSSEVYLVEPDLESTATARKVKLLPGGRVDLSGVPIAMFLEDRLRRRPPGKLTGSWTPCDCSGFCIEKPFK